jgi:four helix bundle protein
VALAHHTLVAWQRADDLFIKLHQLSLKAFPAFEKFELGGQLRRSAFSVPVNIVEGFATEYGRRRLNFLTIAKSSLAEVGYCIHVALRLGYVDEKAATELDGEIRRVGAPLAGLIAAERLKVNAHTAGVIL